MYIALDARAAFHPQPGGFKTYTTGLLWGLAQIAPTRHRFLLLLDRDCYLGDSLPEHFTQRVVPSRIPMVGAFYREQVRIPRVLLQEGVHFAHFLCNVTPIFSPVPYLVTIHDLDPLRCRPTNPRKSLHDQLLWMYWRLLIPIASRRSLAILTSSEFSKRELEEHLRVSPERIFVIPLAASRSIRRVERTEAQKVVEKKYDLKSPFILAFASKEPRKNLRRILCAYSRLAPALRETAPLVLVVSHKQLYCSVIRTLQQIGLVDQVRLIPSPNDDLLSAFYSAAHIFLFPSLYEGFGMPVLEAMKCGCPVITSTCSSLPEVAGDAAILVDPTHTEEIRAAMEQLLTDPDLWGNLSAQGLMHSRKFSWQITGQKVLEIYDWAAKRVRVS